MTNIFEQATRQNLTFNYEGVGSFSISAVWNLPLSDSKKRVDLNRLAISINEQLQKHSVANFVDVKPEPHVEYLKLQLDIVKHIINVLQTEKNEATQEAAKQSKIKRIREVLAKKQNDNLENLTEEQLKAELIKLEIE